MDLRTLLLLVFSYTFGAWTVLVLLPSNCATALFHPLDSAAGVPVAFNEGGGGRAGLMQHHDDSAAQLAARRNGNAEVREAPRVKEASSEPVPPPPPVQRATEAPRTPEPPPKVVQAGGSDGSKTKTTVLITVECIAYHDWQSVVVIHSLEQLRRDYPESHNYDIHRIVSCAKEEPLAMQALAPWTRSPPMSPHPKTGFSFPTLNKPAALNTWMLGPGRDLDDDHELIITDPDFLYMGPMPIGQSRLGRPIAGRYRMGDAWTRDKKIMSYCEGKCDGLLNNRKEVEEHWVGGPPYIIRMGDARKIIPVWLNITEQMVLDGDKKIAWGVPGGWLADMYAYIMGSYMHGIIHTLRDDLFVSDGHEAEWSPFDRSGTEKWPAIHFCQDYDVRKALGEPWSAHFNKHSWHERDPKNLTLLSCDADKQQNIYKDKGWNPPPALLADEEPPVTRRVLEWNQENLKKAEGERTVWLLWKLKRGFDAAFAEYRLRNCD